MSTGRPIVFFTLMLLSASLSLAQVSTAELSGTVADQTGAVIGRAKVIATNADTGVSREASTDAAGAYVMTLLPPGNYNLSVEAQGFRWMLRSGVTLEVNQRARVDFALQVGQVNETVEVAASAPLLESQSSSLGSVISERFVNELQLNGRNFVQLAILSPGVNGVGFSVTGTVMSGARPDDRRPGSEIFSSGNREGANNFLYDGADNNERLTLSIVLRPAVEAVKEFKVQYSDNVTFTSGKNTWKFGGDIRRRQFTDWRALLPPVAGTSPGQPSSAPIGFDRPRANLHADVSPSKSTARLFLCWFNVKWRIGALR